MSSYAANKRWRHRHPKKRYMGKARYYGKYRDDPECMRNAGQEWTLSAIERIIAPDRPLDSILAKELGRSLQAIQQMRNKLKKTNTSL